MPIWPANKMQLACAGSSRYHYEADAVVAMGADVRALGAQVALVTRNGIRACGHRDAGPSVGTTRGNVGGPGG